MGYKLVGFAVWQGGKWYLRRRLRRTRRKLAVAGIAAIVVAGVLAAARQSGSE